MSTAKRQPLVTDRRSHVALDPKAISRLVARRFRGRCYVQKNLAPLQLTPREIAANLPAVMAKLAETAAREGGLGWTHWLACADTDAAGVGKAIKRLLEHEAYWFASWCWLHDRDELGVAAYEQFLARKRALGTDLDATENYYCRIGVNQFATFSFVATALRLGCETSALRALEPVCKLFGARTSDDILLAILRCKAGKLAATTVRRVIARSAKGASDLDLAARAVALQILGDEAAAREVVAGFDRETGLPPAVQHELSKRFGLVFE